MQFKLDSAILILERTPNVLRTYLKDLSEEWIHQNEGAETWSPFDIIGHLIHGEQTDWIARTKIILSNSSDKEFTPFDRFAQFENSKGKSINDLLLEFEHLRAENIQKLKAFDISDEDLEKKGIHPAFGKVSLRQLLSTWVAHDLGHIMQISRVMAKQYKTEVGPWTEYLRVLQE